MSDTRPLSLYVHFPWCVHKCPYCDFNSHAIKGTIPEQQYIGNLLTDLEYDLERVNTRPITTIFFGGGTPSLISGAGIEFFLTRLRARVDLVATAEITLEANPGAIDSEHFEQYRAAGVNRLSIGAQSLRNQQLQRLGRIHTSNEILTAFRTARAAGFDNINLDLMFGLPEDTPEGSQDDLRQVIALQAEHLSWYQLTMEPNTRFYQQRPALPDEELIWELQQAGQALLEGSGYTQYEVSAYARAGRRCRHNLNYWQFGDYLGLGAGAHSKISQADLSVVERFSRPRHPKKYLAGKTRRENYRVLNPRDLILEFMMNALRLNEGFQQEDFEQNTGLSFSYIELVVDEAINKSLIKKTNDKVVPTELGRTYLNDMLSMFMEISTA